MRGRGRAAGRSPRRSGSRRDAPSRSGVRRGARPRTARPAIRPGAGGSGGARWPVGSKVLEEPRLDVLGGDASAGTQQRADLDPAHVAAATQLQRLEPTLARPPADRLRTEVNVRAVENLARLSERDPVRGRTAHRGVIDPPGT